MTENVAKVMHDMIAMQLAKKGRLVNGGWNIFCDLIMPPDASEVQRQEMRKAFFSGASHVFFCLCVAVDHEESSEDSCNVMELLEKELNQFAAEFEAKLKKN